MCVIINMKPGTLMEFDAWFNAVHNNEHGFGMIVRKPRKGKLDELVLIKRFGKDGLDPEELYNLVKENMKYDRWIHLRYKTAGSVSADNVQPFKVFEDGDKIAYFMHNGTLSDYKDYEYDFSGMYGGSMDEVIISDSQKFGNEEIGMVLPYITGEKGVGDYTSPFYQRFITDLWKAQGPATNRGIIISNYASSLILNTENWTEFFNSGAAADGKTYEQFKVSNDSYFESLKRGSLKKKQEEEERKKKEEERKKQLTVYNNNKADKKKNVSSLSSFRPDEPILTTIPKLSDIFGDPDIFDGDNISAHYLAAVTQDEWIEILKGSEFTVCAYILSRVCEEMFDVSEELFEKRDELDRLEQREIELGNLVSRLRAQVTSQTDKIKKLEKDKEKAKEKEDA